MKEKIKKIISTLFSRVAAVVGNTAIGVQFYEQVINYSMNRSAEVYHNGLRFKFAMPNTLSKWRIKSFSTKEPETLEWIDTLPEGSILWDIGANIGLYSIYAAHKKNCRVYAFEPSVFNLELLARNIYLNNLSDKICIVPFALSDGLTISQMRMTSTEWGGALSTFGKEFGWDGQAIKQTFDYQLLGLSIEDAIDRLSLPFPDYIKMDVDGLEHFILKGGVNVLPNIKGILIEVNDDFSEQANQCVELLTAAGLTLKEKRHSAEIDNSDSGFENTFNQIWVRQLV